MRQSHTLHNSHFEHSHKCRPSDIHLHYHRREWFVYNLRFLLLIIEVNIIIEFRYAKLSGHDNILDYEKYFLSKTYTYKMSYVLIIFFYVFWTNTSKDYYNLTTNIFCECNTTKKPYLSCFFSRWFIQLSFLHRYIFQNSEPGSVLNELVVDVAHDELECLVRTVRLTAILHIV